MFSGDVYLCNVAQNAEHLISKCALLLGSFFTSGKMGQKGDIMDTDSSKIVTVFWSS